VRDRLQWADTSYTGPAGWLPPCWPCAIPASCVGGRVDLTVKQPLIPCFLTHVFVKMPTRFVASGLLKKKLGLRTDWVSLQPTKSVRTLLHMLLSYRWTHGAHACMCDPLQVYVPTRTVIVLAPIDS
jgi:hypothetical protein